MWRCLSWHWEPLNVSKNNARKLKQLCAANIVNLSTIAFSVQCTDKCATRFGKQFVSFVTFIRLTWKIETHSKVNQMLFLIDLGKSWSCLCMSVCVCQSSDCVIFAVWTDCCQYQCWGVSNCENLFVKFWNKYNQRMALGKQMTF